MTPRHRTLLLALGALLAVALAVSPPRPREVPPAATPADVYGDPLPAGAVARMGSLRLRHEGETSCVAFSPDGKTLVVESYTTVDWDRGPYSPSLRLWDRATGKELRRLPDPEELLYQLAFSPDGKTLMGRGHRGVYFWDTVTGKPARQAIRPGDYLADAALSPDGKTLATTFQYVGRMFLWDPATGKQLRRLSEPREAAHHLVFSADGKCLLSGSSAYAGNEVLLWDTRTWKVLRRFTGEGQPVALSPDGRTVALRKETGFHRYTIRLWDLEADRLRCRFAVRGDAVHCLFSPDGRLLATDSMGEPVRVRDVATGKELGQFGGPRPQNFVAAFSRDGWFLAAIRHDEVRLWDVRTGREACPVGGHREPVSCLAFSPDGKALLSGSDDRTVRVWEARTGKELRRFGGHRAAVSALALSPDGRTVASGEGEGNVLLWDAATGQERRRLSLPGGVEAIAFARDGRALAATTAAGAIRVWDAATGKRLSEVRVERQPGLAAALSPGGAAVAYSEQTPTRPPDDAAGVIHLRGLLPARVLPPIRGANAPHRSLVFSRDGKFLAAVQESSVRVWETATGREVLRVGSVNWGPAAFSPDGRTLFTGGCQAWDLATGKPLGLFAGHIHIATSLAVSPDSTRVAAGSDDGTILVWDATRLPRPGLTAPRELAGAWADLAGADAARAYQALWALTSDPRRTVSFLGQHLRPAPPLDARKIHRLIAALDGESFAERQKATEELRGLGESAEGALRAALAGRPSLEVRRRVERLLAQPVPPSGERLRALRAVVVLERIGTPQARKLLEELTGGAPQARLTREAQEALRRLAAKP